MFKILGYKALFSIPLFLKKFLNNLTRWGIEFLVINLPSLIYGSKKMNKSELHEESIFVFTHKTICFDILEMFLFVDEPGGLPFTLQKFRASWPQIAECPCKGLTNLVKKNKSFKVLFICVHFLFFFANFRWYVRIWVHAS